MAVLESARTYSGATVEVDENSARQHTLKWRVKTDNEQMSGVEVLVAARSATPNPVPDLFDPCPGDSAARCKSISAQQSSESPRFWLVDAYYDSKYSNDEQQSSDPVLRRPVYTIEFQQFQHVCERAVTGEPITNSLQQVFVPAIEAEDSRPVLVVQRNLRSLYDVIPLMLTFKDAINDRPFYGAQRHQAKIKSITAGQAGKENGFEFIPVTFRIEFQGEGQTWDKVLLNTAMRFYSTKFAADAKVPLIDMIDGTRVTEPVPIDEDGVYIRRDPVNGELLSEPVYRTYQIFPERNFNLLGF